MTTSHYDAIIIGAGISGISAAYHLQKHNKTKTYKILERRQALGGTWDLFNYPGVRSDSDMYTFGFSFRHWNDKSTVAEKSKIVDYLKATSREFSIDQHIEYGHDIVSARWSSDDSLWSLETRSGEYFSCRFLYMCSGYYSYDKAHTPAFPGVENFKGEIIHPQFWPEYVNYENKKVVVIGSGATAITLVPSLAEKAKHVTMLQRSPTYLRSQPSVDPIANGLGKLFGRWAARWWFILSNMFFYWVSKTFPEWTKAQFLAEISEQLGEKYDEKHFKPSYKPWDQRVCLCPDGDLFAAIKTDKASIETDQITEFTDDGIRLTSGKTLDADIIVTATGLQIEFLGGIQFEIDGKRLVPNSHYVYKGMMLSGVPNAFLAIGYTNASWTLKVDLSNRYASRLISYMDKHRHQKCTARANRELHDAPLLELSSGYIQRALSELPKQATVKPWCLSQNYLSDTLALKFSKVNDEVMIFD